MSVMIGRVIKKDNINMCGRLIVIIMWAVCIEGLQFCVGPSGRNGTCKSITDCPSVDILNATGTYQDTSNSCGDDMTEVCCEEDPFCYTIDWQEGICVGVHECPSVTDTLKSKVFNEIKTYLTNNRCNGPELLSICCGPRPSNEAPSLVDCQSNPIPSDPRTCCCGKDNRRIPDFLDSNQTSIGQYPWLVLIEYKKNNKLKLLCGGSLISGRYVLTAGHCVAGQALYAGEPVNVRLGEYDLSNDGPDCIIIGRDEQCTEGITVIPIEEIIIHPYYNARRTASRHDIALLRLFRNAPYSDFIRPICLPTIDHTLNMSDGSTLWATGWGVIDGIGRNTIKLHFELPFKTLESCQPEYSTSKTNALWRGQLCAGGLKNKDTCKGDSGGPLMYKSNETIELMGIVSFGPKICGTENIPGVYTKVYEYMPWIRGHIRP